MIKTDAQLERTHKSIDSFKRKIREAQEIEDSLARDLATASYQGMITMLELEIERYENAKKGIVRMPASISSILDLCPFLTDIRIALGWTQERLGSQLSISRQAVNQMEEHEYRNIDVERLQQILEVLGLKPQIFVQHNAIRLIQPGDDNYLKSSVAIPA